MAPKLTAEDHPPAPPVAHVEAVLTERIRTGVYPANSWLPAERVLSEELGVHRRIIRLAIARLADCGLVSIRPRCRPIVVSYRASPRVRSTVRVAPPRAHGLSASRLIALVMWHGGFEQGATAQQRIFWGMNQAFDDAGYHGVFLDLGGEMDDPDDVAAREAARLQSVLDQGFGGLVFYSFAYASNRQLIQEVAKRVPMVLIDRMVPGIEADFVGVDNRGAMYEATAHLLSRGHRRIAYITRAEPINTVQDRLEGYRRALRDHGGAGVAEMVLTATASTEPEWRANWPVFDVMFRLPPPERPTAALCVNDYVAANVASRLTALGLRIPEDVALAGFDNIVQVLPNGEGLTTVAQPFEEIGRTAARTLLWRMNHPGKPPAHHELPAALIARSSSAQGVPSGHTG